MIASATTHVSLLERIGSGADDAAWREFCDRYGELIRGFAARRGLQPADRDDLMQDVLVAIAKAMPGFIYDPSKGKFRSYLKTVALHAIFKRSCQSDVAIDLSRIDELTRSAAGSEEVDQQWELQWRQYHLRRALKTVEGEFNATDLAAFRAYALDGESVAEVTKRFGLSADSVYQAKSRILKRLGEAIDQQVAEEG